MEAQDHDVRMEAQPPALHHQELLVDAVAGHAQIDDFRVVQAALQERWPGLLDLDALAEGERVAQGHDAQGPRRRLGSVLPVRPEALGVDAHRNVVLPAPLTRPGARREAPAEERIVGVHTRRFHAPDRSGSGPAAQDDLGRQDRDREREERQGGAEPSRAGQKARRRGGVHALR